MTAGADLTMDAIGEPHRGSVSTQSYGAATPIEGVRLIDLRLFSDEGGDFSELARFDASGVLEAVEGFQPGEISYSLVMPGAIKAWHLHLRQDDLWFVPPSDRLLVGLVDLRHASPTFEASMRFVLGAGRSRGLLLIPRGVAHGTANRSGRQATLVYFTSRQFDPASPDEHRLSAATSARRSGRSDPSRRSSEHPSPAAFTNSRDCFD